MEELTFNAEDLIIDADNYVLDDNDKQVKEVIPKRETQLKRWFITLNNPFWTDEFEEVDLKTTDLFVKHDYYNFEYIKNFSNIDLFEFHFIKVTAQIEEDVEEKVIVEKYEDGQRILTENILKKRVKVNKEFVVERPYFKNYECLQTYIENLQVDGLKYAVGQIEKGKEGTVHLQAGLIFDEKHGKRFYTMKKYLPTAYLAKAKGSNYDIKTYCTKEDTRLEQPFEIGKFVEMRTRSDMEEFKCALKAGATNSALMEDFFHIVAQIGLKNIDVMRTTYLSEEYENKARNVEVTFIYGKGGTGKTKSVFKEHGANNVFRFSNYGQFCFHGYKCQKVLLLDEFTGQLKLQTFNEMTDAYPYSCNTKGGQVSACYEKIYIISNIPYYKIYGMEKQENPDIYETFDRRIHHIFEVDDKGNFKRKRETIFEEIPEEEVEIRGWTKRPCKRIEYDVYGLPHVVYDRYKKEQMEMTCLGEIEEDILFGKGDDEK